jgi:hypothetical protein
MKKFLLVLSIILTSFLLVGPASALLFSETQHQDVSFNSSLTSYTWKFNLNDPLDYGDIMPGDKIDWALLSIRVKDDELDIFAKEYADLKIDGTTYWNKYEVNSWIYTWGVSALLQDHLLSVSMYRDLGDFKVDWVSVNGGYTAVPEPSTMLLLGFGLLGLAGAGRKKFLKK